MLIDNEDKFRSDEGLNEVSLSILRFAEAGDPRAQLDMATVIETRLFAESQLLADSERTLATTERQAIEAEWTGMMVQWLMWTRRAAGAGVPLAVRRLEGFYRDAASPDHSLPEGSSPDNLQLAECWKAVFEAMGIRSKMMNLRPVDRIDPRRSEDADRIGAPQEFGTVDHKKCIDMEDASPHFPRLN